MTNDMKHLAIIQTEFLKLSRLIRAYESAVSQKYDWDTLSREQQEKYLRKHPESKRKLTATFGGEALKVQQVRGLFVKALYRKFAQRFDDAGYKLPDIDKLTFGTLPKDSPFLGWSTKNGLWVSQDYFHGSNIKALKRLMLHEMCHNVIELKYLHHQELKPKDHGSEFRAVAKAVGADPSAIGSELDRWIGVPKKDRHY
jgi:hypothetical protein